MAINEFELAKAYVTLDPRGRADMERALGSVKRSAVDMSDALKTASRHARRLLVVGAGVVGLSIKMAADAEAASGKFRAVFKGQADEVERWADKFGDSVGRTTDQLKPFLSQLQDTFVPLGFARDRASDLSKELTTLGLDLASFNDIADSDAINALTSALVGNHETVRKFGVIITQATLDLQLMEMGFPKVTKGATEQQKVLARLAIITKSTGDAQGDLSKTQGELNNQIKKLTGEFQELMIELGKAFIPAMNELLPIVTDMAKAVAAWVKENKEGIPSLVKWTAIIVGFVAIAPRAVFFLGLMVGMYNKLAAAQARSAIAGAAASKSMGGAAGGFALKAVAGVATSAGGVVLAALGAYALFISGPIMKVLKDERRAREANIAAINKARKANIAKHVSDSRWIAAKLKERRGEVADITGGGLRALPEVTTTIAPTAEEILEKRTKMESEGLATARTALDTLKQRGSAIDQRTSRINAEVRADGTTLERFRALSKALTVLDQESIAVKNSMSKLAAAIGVTEENIADRDKKEHAAASIAARDAAQKKIQDKKASDVQKQSVNFSRTSAAGLQAIFQDTENQKEILVQAKRRGAKLDEINEGIDKVAEKIGGINGGFR